MAAVAGRVRGRLAVLVLAQAGRALTGLAVPSLVAAAVDAVLDDTASGGQVAALAAVLLAGGVCEVVTALAFASGAGAGTAWLRERTVGHLLRLGPRSRFAAGDAVTRVAHSTVEAANAPLALASTVVALLSAAGGLVMLWVIDWRVGLAFTVAVPPAVAVTHSFFGGVSDVHARYLAAQAGISDRLVAALTGLRTIRAAGTVAAEADRVLAGLPELSAVGYELWGVQRRSVWRLRLLVPITEVGVLAVAGWVLSRGQIGPGELLAVTGYVAVAGSGFGQIDTVLGLGTSRASARRIAEALAEPAPVAGDARLPGGDGAVRWCGVTVRRGDRLVLDRLDLAVPAGAAVAIVGHSGAGKSALTELVGRLADPDGGEVLLDGVDVRTLAPDALRGAVAYAFDTPVLLGGTVREAIGYGTPARSGGDVVAAAVAAHADGFITRLPRGYDTDLIDVPMSGGELQRVGLARAVARDARVYVLDDATSGLDTVTEAQVRHALTRMLAGRTRLVVAHRSATAAECDLVAWVDGGRLRGLAPHHVLCAQPDYRAVFGETDEDGTGTEDPDACVSCR